MLTDSDAVKAYRKSIMQLMTLNHPVDCGICDKAGECTLQDYHYKYNGAPSVSHDAKVRSTKFHPLSERIVLDNERCILCSRCVRFTREISKSNALGIVQRGDASLVRAAEDRPLDADPYSDNIIDLCPVGALLSRPFLYKARVWYLKPTPSVCPGCARGCTVQIWHRKPEWKLNALDPRQNVSDRARDAAREPAGQRTLDLQQGARPRADLRAPARRAGDAEGQPVDLPAAIDAARRLIDGAKRAGRAGVELGLERRARRVQAGARRALHRFRQAGLGAAAGRAARRRSAHPRGQEPQHRRGPRACSRSTTTARAPSPRIPTWS